jgi:hypothetical protein
MSPHIREMQDIQNPFARANSLSMVHVEIVANQNKPVCLSSSASIHHRQANQSLVLRMQSLYVLRVVYLPVDLGYMSHMWRTNQAPVICRDCHLILRATYLHLRGYTDRCPAYPRKQDSVPHDFALMSRLPYYR